MTLIVDQPEHPIDVVPSVPRSRPRWSVVVVVVAVALSLVAIDGARNWSKGGTFLTAGAGGYGGPVLPNERFSIGIQLETKSGNDLTLDGVSAFNSAGSKVRWSIYKSAPGHMGFGAIRGPLLPSWPTVPVRGYRVMQPAGDADRGATWLIASVSTSRSGVFYLGAITIAYHSGRHARHVSAQGDLCLLVDPRARQARFVRELNLPTGTTDLNALDPLIAKYERCLGDNAGF